MAKKVCNFSLLESLLKIFSYKTIFLYLVLLLCIILFLRSVNAQVLPILFPYPISPIQVPRFVPNQAIIFFKPGVTMLQILSLYSFYGLKEISISPISGARTVFTPPLINLQELIVRLNMEAIVLLAEPNFISRVEFIPNDPYYSYQWHLRIINIENAWNLSTGLGSVVAVLDTGVAFENFDIYAQAPDLSGTRFVAGWDFVNNDANPDDDNGHGTHITGTIAQTTNNFYGCAGVAFNATIMPVKVMDSTGNGGLTDIVDGIYFAINNGAQIINMSFGFGNNPTLSLETAVNYAYNNGVTMVCSAGNNSTNLPNYPASYPICISVSGVRYDLTIGDYSNYGTEIDICAPGGDLTVDQNLDGFPDGILQQSHDGTNFTTFSFLLGKGTSWAAAHVSGVIALMQSTSGGLLSPADIDLILKQTAVDLGTAGWDQYYGYGLVDSYAALLATTQATIATAEAIIASTIPLVPLSQSLATSTLQQPQNTTGLFNPIAIINGDLSPLASYYLTSPSQTQQTYSDILSNPLYLLLSSLNYSTVIPSYNYFYLTPFFYLNPLNPYSLFF